MRKHKGRFANIEKSEASPLEFAVSARDQSALTMVAAALRHKEAMLAFQPVVQSRSPDRIELWLNLVFGRFEGWRRIWLNCCCETAAQPKEIHHHGND